MTYALRDALVGLTPCASTIVGAATQHSELAQQAHAIGGDPPRDPIGSRSDLWSVGVVLASLCLAPLCLHGSRLVGRGPKLSGSALPKGAPLRVQAPSLPNTLPIDNPIFGLFLV